MSNNEELQKKVEETTAEHARRYPLLELVNNRMELEAISLNTLEYMKAINPEVRISKWELVPRVAIDFLKSTFEYLARKKTTKVDSIFIDIGDVLQAGIEYTDCRGDKDGTFNPFIKVGPEMAYEKYKPEDDGMSDDLKEYISKNEGSKYIIPQLYKNKEEIKEISTTVVQLLNRKFGAKTDDWSLMSFVFICFMRQVREYLILHKDDDVDLDIDLGNVCNMGIEKINTGDESNPGYHIYVTPGQSLKLITKDDGETEE